MKFLPKRDSPIGITIYYFSMVAFLVAGIRAWQGQSFFSILLFSLAFLTMILQDVAWFLKRRIHPHDQQLLDRLFAALQSQETLALLKQQDFLTHSYHSHDIESLVDINENWGDIGFHFVGNKLEERWQQMRADIQALLQLLTQDQFVFNPHFFCLVPPADKAPSAETLKTAKAKAERANTLARRVYQHYQALKQVSIDKM